MTKRYARLTTADIAISFAQHSPIDNLKKNRS
jgi:hypothetical protein